MINVFIRSLEKDKDSWLRKEAEKITRQLSMLSLFNQPFSFAEWGGITTVSMPGGKERKFNTARRKRKIGLSYRDIFITENGRVAVFIGLEPSGSSIVRGAKNMWYLQGEDSPTYYAYIPEVLIGMIKKVKCEFLQTEES